MVLYTCEKCGYSTKLKGDFKKHLNRKNPCFISINTHLSNTIEENNPNSLEKSHENCSQMLTNCSQMLTNSKMRKKNKVTNEEFCKKKNEQEHNQHHTENKKSHEKVMNEQFVSNCEQFVSNNEQNEQKSHEKISKFKKRVDSDPIDFDQNCYQCNYCKKQFSRNSNLRRHVNLYCKRRSHDGHEMDFQDVIDTLDELKKDTGYYRKKEEEWNLERNELYKKLEKANKNIYNNNYFSQNNIIIHNHGEEDIHYISQDYLTELIKLPFQAIPKLIKHIHFHPEHPENHNIKITNKKEPYIRVYKNQKWNFADKKKVIGGMLDKSVSILDNHFSEQGSQFSEVQKIRYGDFTENFSDETTESDFKKKYEKDLELLVMNESND